MAGNDNTAGKKAPGAGDKPADATQSAAEMVRDGAEKARTAFQDHVMEPAKRAGEAIKASGERIAESGSVLGAKVIDQAETNAREAFAAMRAAATAKDPGEIMRIQGDYLRQQGERAVAQAKEIGEMIVQFGRDATASVRGESKPPVDKG